MTCTCCKEDSPHASSADLGISISDNDLSESMNDPARQQALLDSTRQLLADQPLPDECGGHASAGPGAERSIFGAGAWQQQQYLQAGFADHSLGLSEAVTAAAGILIAFDGSPGADWASIAPVRCC